MNFECEECKGIIYWDDDWCQDDAGEYHDECREIVTARQQAEAGIPPHGYRVNTNAAYDWGNYKNTDYMEEVLDSA